MMRVRRFARQLWDNQWSWDDSEIQGLACQLGFRVNLTGITDKEELMFPIAENMAWFPTKVMWSRLWFARKPHAATAEFWHLRSKSSFEALCASGLRPWLREESIPLAISAGDDWLSIAEESDAYGYAIILPSEKWVPKRWTSGRGARKSQRFNHFLKKAMSQRAFQVIETPEAADDYLTPKKKRRESFDEAATGFWPWLSSVASEFNLWTKATNGDQSISDVIFSNITMMLRLWGDDF